MPFLPTDFPAFPEPRPHDPEHRSCYAQKRVKEITAWDHRCYPGNDCISLESGLTARLPQMSNLSVNSLPVKHGSSSEAPWGEKSGKKLFHLGVFGAHLLAVSQP